MRLGVGPARGVVCERHPTVMMYNMHDHRITLDPGDIAATVCPTMEDTRHNRVDSAWISANKDRTRNRGGRERRANVGLMQINAGRLPDRGRQRINSIATHDNGQETGRRTLMSSCMT